MLQLFFLEQLKQQSNEPVEINDSTIGFYQSTTCNMSLINVVKKNLQNDLDLRFNNNNYAGLECFGKVTGLDKVGNIYILSIGTNSNITIIIQSLIWISSPTSVLINPIPPESTPTQPESTPTRPESAFNIGL